MIHNTQVAYGSLTKAFHWTLAVLMVGMFLCGELLDTFNRGFLFDWHKKIGMFVLILSVLWILWKHFQVRPLWKSDMPRHEQILAKSVHHLLYLSLILMPLRGWIMATYKGHPPVFGALEVPFPGLHASREYGHLMNQVHGTLAWVIVGIVSLHVLGALKHHFIDKNDILKRMLPFQK